MNSFALRPGDGSSKVHCGANFVFLQMPVYLPPCECIECQMSFYPALQQHSPLHSYHRVLNDADAELLMASTLDTIHDKRHLLHQRLGSFADVLMSRWKKRSQAKREALLKQVAPDLDEEQWIIPRYSYMPERFFFQIRSLKRRRQLLLPWFNIEVLKNNPTVLFALLHYRTAYGPEDWAAFDSSQLDASWIFGWLNVNFAPKCIVMHGSRYGQVVDWEKDAAHRADIMGFPRASLVLEAQAYLIDTLYNIVEKILEGADLPHPPRVEKWREITRNAAFKETGEVELWSPFTNQPFSAPPRFDIDNFLSLARARIEQTGDHLRYLQCDAAYMKRHVRTLCQLFKTAPNVQNSSLIADYIRLEIDCHHSWRWLESECRHVDEMRKGFADSMRPGSPLPMQYSQALGALESLARNRLASCCYEFKAFAPYNTSLLNHWTFQFDPNLMDAVVMDEKNTNANTRESMIKDPLNWCLIQLFKKPEDPGMYDPAMLFAFLKNHFSNNPSERQRLDEPIYQILSDISAYYSILFAIHMHRPQFPFRDVSECSRTEDRESWKWTLFNHGKIDYQKEQEVYRNIGIPLMKHFNQSPNGPRGPARLASYAAIEKFWEGMRKKVDLEFSAAAMTRSEIDDLLEVISVNLSPEYLENKKREEDALLAAMDKTSDEPHPVVNTFSTAEPEPKVEWSAPHREKPKTRGDAHGPISDSGAIDSVPEAQNTTVERVATTPLTVKKQSLELFRLMFSDNEEEKSGTEIPWDRFVHAMVDAGFPAMNMGGSAVSFSDSSGTGGKIVFHKPHPVAKINRIMLRVMGKRMARHFGWNRDTFVLRDDVAEE